MADEFAHRLAFVLYEIAPAWIYYAQHEAQRMTMRERAKPSNAPIDFAFNLSPLRDHKRILLSGEPTAMRDESWENSTDDTLARHQLPLLSYRNTGLTLLRHQKP